MRKAKATKWKKHTATVRSAQYEYTVIFEPAEGGSYVVRVPALNGIATHGETLDEARTMAEDLIRGYLQSLRKHGEPIRYHLQPAALAQLDALITEGVNSGLPVRVTPEWWKDRYAELARQRRQRDKKQSRIRA